MIVDCALVVPGITGKVGTERFSSAKDLCLLWTSRKTIKRKMQNDEVLSKHSYINSTKALRTLSRLYDTASQVGP